MDETLGQEHSLASICSVQHRICHAGISQYYYDKQIIKKINK